MKRFYILFIALLFIDAPIFGQDVEPEAEKKEILKISIPNATIKFNIPVLLWDPKHAIFIATDTRLGKYFSLDMGVGYYFYLNDRASYNGESFSGIRGRLGIKYYYVFGRRLAPYVGFEGMLNRYNIEEYKTVCRFGCQYQENMLIDREVKANGVAARTGLMIFLGEKKRFFFDAYAGIGYKFTGVSDNTPSDGEVIDTSDFFESLYDSDPGEYYVPNIILGIHFGYAFW